MTAILTGKTLSRRTFLMGMGAAVALPMLDAMAAPAVSSTAAATPPRLAFIYIPNGVDIHHWTPAVEGPLRHMPYILEPLAPYRQKLLVLSGLTHNNARALGSGAGDHARAAAAFLTGVHPNKTAGADIHNGISVDQVAAQAIGHQTRFGSLELTAEPARLAGNCDSGYSCAYSNSISWRTAKTPNPPEGNPRQVFNRLFGGGAAATVDPAVLDRQKRFRGSILDFVLEDTQRLQRTLGPTDRGKLDEYLHSIRAVERQIQFNEQREAGELAQLDVPESAPAHYGDYTRLLFDLQTLAFQTDQTRVITFMMAREGSNRTYREIGVNESHHGLSHHEGNPEKITQIRDINRYHIDQLAYFLGKLDSTPDGDGTLLDHATIVYGSAICDGNRHNHDNLPVLLAGGASGGLHTGRHVRYENETPMTNLYLNLLEYAGIPTDKMGDSTGKLDYLTEV